jgi:hypothetical protein
MGAKLDAPSFRRGFATDDPYCSRNSGHLPAERTVGCGYDFDQAEKILTRARAFARKWRVLLKAAWRLVETARIQLES